MEHVPPFERPFPWRTAAAVLALLATAELIGLLVLAGVHLVPSLDRATPRGTVASAARPSQLRAPARRQIAPAQPLRPRSRVSVLVLNGNGVTGAAGAEAERLLSRGYRHAVAADAPNHDYARSLVLFAPGWEREAQRLAQDTQIRVVAALDGMRPSQLRGSQLVVILGDS